MIECQKHCFDLPDDEHYLNGAYMAPMSRAVSAVGHAALDRLARPGAVGPADFFDEATRVRSFFARLVGASEPDRIAIIPSVSYGLAVVARNVRLGPGQNVVVAEEQFPSNIYSWRRLCATSGAELRTVRAPGTAAERGVVWNRSILEAIDPGTGLVALPHLHWADGTRFDLAAIGSRARDFDACFVVDGTQSVGATPFDIETVRPDALICAGYKWLTGPYGIGVAYYGPRFDEGIPNEENWISRAGSDNFAGLVRYQDAYRPGAIRYDVGERSTLLLLPMLAAALDQVLTWTPEGVQDYCRALTRQPIETLREQGCWVGDDAWRESHLFGLRMPHGIDVALLAAALAARRVRVSVRGATLRVAPYLYNDETDLDALVDVVAAAIASPTTAR